MACNCAVVVARPPQKLYPNTVEDLVTKSWARCLLVESAGFSTQDFREFNNAAELLLLEPQHTDVEVANPSYALTLEDP